ncbi:hypothetical protein [Kordiimonas sp. SCSIO 12610]|uniref:hypothetical protein n=1 Tax=Kordiimonas sp. SCSIO 12610 TaxID=2829597 RepID=UPI00210E921B|nr:hypothetical protein [Kordiimonas sp. SCSIO 12610]UTW56704.1 hypothetical protein KFF44_07395 [Kordiimonas sp. SCSIO 12610]
MSKICLFISMVMSLLVLVETAVAQDGKIVDQFLKCGEIADDTARLACLDDLLGTVNKTRSEFAEKAEAQKKADFGKRTKDDPDSIDTIKAGIERFTQNNVSKNYTFFLDNGQVWRTNSSGKKIRIPSKPSYVVIERAVFGSFKITVYNDKGRNSRTVKAKRVQ